MPPVHHKFDRVRYSIRRDTDNASARGRSTPTRPAPAARPIWPSRAPYSTPYVYVRDVGKLIRRAETLTGPLPVAFFSVFGEVSNPSDPTISNGTSRHFNGFAGLEGGVP
jgi:hypothetical protein